MKKNLLGIEITDQKIRYVCVSQNLGKISVKGAGVIASMALNTSAPENFTTLIRDIIAKEDFAPSRIFLTISRADTVIHQAIFPSMPPSEREEVVAYEIEKIPAFFDKEFDFIYQSYEFTHKRQKVLFAAINQKLLDTVIQGTRAAQRPFQDLEITPLNLAAVLSQSKISSREQVFVILDDHITYLLVFAQQQYKCFYTTSLGQSDLYPPGNSSLDEINFSHWAEELKRVLKSYLMENKKQEQAIDKLCFIWDEENAPALGGLLAKAIGIAVEIPQVEKFFGGPVEFDKVMGKFNMIYLLTCVPILCHLRKLKPQFPLDHFVRKFQLHRHIYRTVTVCLAFIALVGFGFTSATLFLKKEEKQFFQKFTQITAEISRLEKESSDLFAERNKYLDIRDNLLRQATYVKILNRMSWSKVLWAVSNDLPKELCLTSFKVMETGQTYFSGESVNMESISELIRRVDTSSIVKNGKFSYLREKEIFEQKIFTFGILANLRLDSNEK